MVSKLMNPQAVRSQRAFSLIELLVVLSIMTIFAAIAVPSFRSVVRDYELTDAGTRIMGALNQARQTALSRNQNVEVRFYKNTRNNNQYDSIETLLVANTGSSYLWLSKPQFLPTGVVFNTSGTAFSPLIAAPSSTAGDGPAVMGTDTASNTPSSLQNESYVAFQFRPDGSTNLDPNALTSAGATAWCLTLYNTGSASGAGGTPANDFVTILVDPVMGRTRLYQPR